MMNILFVIQNKRSRQQVQDVSLAKKVVHLCPQFTSCFSPTTVALMSMLCPFLFGQKLIMVLPRKCFWTQGKCLAALPSVAAGLKWQ